MAKQLWPSERAVLGHRVRFGGVERNNPWMEIVGVVADSHFEGLHQPPRPEMVLPFALEWNPTMTFVVRTTGNPLSVAGAIRSEIWEVDRDLPVEAISSMAQVVSASIGERNFTLSLLGGFAFVALLLAAIGIYGVFSYTVSQKTREVGLRMALGAGRVEVLILVFRQVLTLTAVGLGIGLVGARLASRLMESLLFGVTAGDPVTYLSISIVIALVALAASCLPALRAAKVDPIVALRDE